MIITVASQHGAGKSTTVGLLLEALPGMHKLEMGIKFRELAAQRGMSVDEFMQFLADNPKESDKVDREMDEHQKHEIEKGNIIIDSSIAAMLAPKALNVLLVCDAKTRAKRVLSGGSRYGDKEAPSIDAMAEQLTKRDENDQQRYLRLYNFDIFDHNNYDLAIDNSKMTKEQVVRKILQELKRHGK